MDIVKLTEEWRNSAAVNSRLFTSDNLSFGRACTVIHSSPTAWPCRLLKEKGHSGKEMKVAIRERERYIHTNTKLKK